MIKTTTEQDNKRITKNIKKLLKNSITLKQVQNKLKRNFIKWDWKFNDLLAIDYYLDKINREVDENRYLNIYRKYDDKVGFGFYPFSFDEWTFSIFLDYIGELIFINKDILLNWSNVK